MRKRRNVSPRASARGREGQNNRVIRSPQITLRVHLGRGRAVHHRRVCPDGRACGHRGQIEFKAHAHMLRHACGFALANKGHDTRALQAYLGHKNIQHSVRYTELSPERFKDFWRE